MERRTFLKLAAASGLALSYPEIARRMGPREAHGGSSQYKGPFFVSIHAGGGWDPTSFCDPKGGEPENRNSVNQFYTKNDIGTEGVFKYAPAQYSTSNGDEDRLVYSAQKFFEQNAHRLRLFNGVDTLTNNHETGTRQTWSGKLSEGYPNVGAMHVATVAKNYAIPLGFISSGGYDSTQGLTSITRTGNIDTIKRIAYPTLPDVNDPERGFHSEKTWSRIIAMQNERVAARNAKKQLPYLAAASEALAVARGGTNELARLFENGNIPEGFELVSNDTFPGPDGEANYYDGFGNIGDTVNLAQQMQLALLAFRAGLAGAANLGIGGFDTHGQHDDNQVPQLMQLLRAVTFLFDQAKEWGLDDQLVVVVGSEFGRTPFYNEGNGKDHWNITSTLVLAEPSLAKTLGIGVNKVIGESTADYKSIGIDPSSLKVKEGGSPITPESLVMALRKTLKVSDDFSKQFALSGEAIELLK